MVIEFELEKDGAVFRDALVFPDDQQFTDVQIEAMKQARFDAWQAFIASQSEE